MPSPTSEHAKCFLTNDQVGFLCAPATLPFDASVAAAFRKLLERVGGDTRELMKEKAMYVSASSLLPAFARREVRGVGIVSAQALFTAGGLCSGAWRFSPACQPELHVCADTSPTLPYRPGFNGEVKSAGDGLALEQAAYYTAMDMTRVFFPAVDATTPCPRRYFTSPPLGFAIVGFPYVAYLVALEWIGKLLVSPLSQPFILESEQHAAAVAGLPDVRYQEPVELGKAAAAEPWQHPAEHPSRLGRVSWRVDGGLFRKLVRGDARTAAQFARMARAYTALAERCFHPVGSAASGAQQRPAALDGLTGLRLLYGAHEVLVEMRALRGRPCSDAEVTSSSSSSSSSGQGVLQGVADALAWLAVRGVVYTDLRGPNVLLEGALPQLVDFDDCVVVEGGGVRSVAGFKAALAAFAAEERLCAGFAVSCAGGAFPQLELALGAAFAQLSGGYATEGDGGYGVGGGAEGGDKRARH